MPYHNQDVGSVTNFQGRYEGEGLKVNKNDLKKHMLLVHICALVADQQRHKKSINWVTQAALGIKDGLDYNISDETVMEMVNTVDQEYQEALGRIKEMKNQPSDEDYLPA